jgi:hypothetical protein
MQWTEWPEYRDAVFATTGKATPEQIDAAYAPLIQRANEEGDETTRHDVQFSLFSLYCRQGQRAEALATLREMGAYRAARGSAFSSELVARALLHDLGEVPLAEEVVDAALAELGFDRGFGLRCADALHLKGLKLDALARRDAPAAEINEVLTDIASLVWGAGYQGWATVGTLEALADTGKLDRSALPLLDMMWATMQRWTQLYNRGDPEILARIESLRARVLATPPKSTE